MILRKPTLYEYAMLLLIMLIPAAVPFIGVYFVTNDLTLALSTAAVVYLFAVLTALLATWARLRRYRSPAAE
jgi:ABC-type glycerol-3-phosphate transport system permease component